MGVVACGAIFLSGGHIRAVEELTGLWDEEAFAKARQIYSQRRPNMRFRGVGSQARSDLHPDPDAEKPLPTTTPALFLETARRPRSEIWAAKGSRNPGAARPPFSGFGFDQ